MWTARRIVILIGGVLITLSSYAVYALFLGGIDGVAPLPLEWGPGQARDTDWSTGAPSTGDAGKFLEKAFGKVFPEDQWPLQLWLPDKGIVFAAGEFRIMEADGRVRLTPFSAAVFHKSKTPDGFPEISTIECDVAYLTLNPPAVHFGDLNHSEVIAVEMLGKTGREIKITNNRGTAITSDDLEVYVNNGSLYFEKRTNIISTDGNVKLLDLKAEPPTEIRGNGLDLYLTKEPNPKQPAAKPAKDAKPRSDSNVDRVVILRDVDMKFWVDPRAGFLGGQPNVKNAPPAPAADGKAAPNKALLHIQTRGKFDYDLTKEFAFFESPTPKDGEPEVLLSPNQDQVHVERIQMIDGTPRNDQLDCDRLDLQFRKSLNPGDSHEMGGDKEIETAKAIRLWTKEIFLLIAGESIVVDKGREMFYRAGDAVNGPLTIITGDVDRPLRAYQKGHKIVCPELHLFAANRAGDGQHAWAKGPGQMWLLDTKSLAAEASYPTTITWRDKLTVVREKEGGQVFDLVTVTGDAHFVDRAEDGTTQELHGNKIMAWINQVQEGADKPLANGGGKQELQRVFAQDNVRGKSSGFIIRRANFFTMTFLPETKGKLPIFAADQRLAANVVNRRPVDGPDGQVVPPAKDGPPIKPIEVNKTPEPEKKSSPPIELDANEITMMIATYGPKKQLHEMIAKGNVYVFQPGDKIGEKRLDIRGQLLTVKEAGLDSHVMTVYGDKQQERPTMARLEMGEIILWGPHVVIDQERNTVNVPGAGAMQMPSNKNLDGTELAKDKKSQRVTVYWNKDMHFDGKLATFFGGVQAFQEGAHSFLKCNDLSVTLDRRVSLKEGQKNGQNAKMDHLFCDKNVYVSDSKVKIDETKGKDKLALVQHNIIEGVYLKSDDDDRTFVGGPGRFRTLGQSGSAAAIGPTPANTDSKDPVWKQTRVDFRDSMVSIKKGNTRTAKFYGLNSGVTVYHFPTIDIMANLDVDHPPKDAFYLQCDNLEVTSQEAAGKTTQLMVARGANVYFKTDKYVGAANTITFNEHTDIIIFEATPGNVVRLVEVVAPGKTQAIHINSRKVLYNRRTGTTVAEDSQSITK